MVNSILATNVVDVLVLLPVVVPHQAVPSKPVVTYAPIISSLEQIVVSTEHFEIGNLVLSNIMYFVDSIDKVKVVPIAPITTFVDKIAAKVVLDTIVEKIVVKVPTQQVEKENYVSLVNEVLAKDAVVIGSVTNDQAQVVFEIV